MSQDQQAPSQREVVAAALTAAIVAESDWEALAATQLAEEFAAGLDEDDVDVAKATASAVATRIQLERGEDPFE